MIFDFYGVPLEKWQEKKDRLGRFLAVGLTADITLTNAGELTLALIPQSINKENISNNGVQ